MMPRHIACRSMLLIVAAGFAASAAGTAGIDLSQATVVVEARSGTGAENMAATVLVEEVERRTGIRLALASARPAGGAAIVVTTVGPMRSVGAGGGTPVWSPESYRLN
ncbi:MAG: hypothetical protein IH602_15560, partial [Bryobacteraceae bacterium]|nr:hypothetical protein [Bryobacteraceae bacterium]